MFIIDFDDTLFNTNDFKKARAIREVDAAEMKQLLFPDTILFLRYLKSIKQKLILLSLGEFDFQNKKIQAVEIADFFDEIVVVPDSKEMGVAKILDQFFAEEDVWFINDKIEETKILVQRFSRLKPLLIMSPRFSEAEYKLSSIPYFSNLTQMQQYAEQQIK